jgi:hypothetical protein
MPQIASNWNKVLDILLDAYKQLGENLPLFSQFASLLSEDPHKQQILMYIYEDILEFHQRAWLIFRMPSKIQLDSYNCTIPWLIYYSMGKTFPINLERFSNWF